MRAALGGRAGWVVRGVGDTPVSVLRRNVSAGEAGRKPPAVPAPSTTRTIMWCSSLWLGSRGPGCRCASYWLCDLPV